MIHHTPPQHISPYVFHDPSNTHTHTLTHTHTHTRSHTHTHTERSITCSRNYFNTNAKYWNMHQKAKGNNKRGTSSYFDLSTQNTYYHSTTTHNTQRIRPRFFICWITFHFKNFKVRQLRKNKNKNFCPNVSCSFLHQNYFCCQYVGMFYVKFGHKI